MYSRILVPLDGSPFAEAAVPLAIDIAERSGGEVKLLMVRELVAEDEHESRTASLDREAWEYVGNAATRLGAGASVRIWTAVRRGRVADEIVSEGNASHDLIVMTSHGRGGLSRFWLGSVSDACTRMSRRPVLLVRPPESVRSEFRPSVKKVVVPLDGSALAESILPAAVGFADAFRVPIALVRSVHVPVPLSTAYFPPTDWIPVDPARELVIAQRYLEEVAARLTVSARRPSVRVVMGPHPARAICDAAGRDGVVAMATHGFGGLRRSVLGSIADKVVRASEGAVLVIRPDGLVTAGRDIKPIRTAASGIVAHPARRIEA